MRFFFRTNMLFLLLMILASCLTGPEYRSTEFKNIFHEKKNWNVSSEGNQPLKNQTENDKTEPSGDISTAQIIQPDWWSNFNDPYLNELIAEAISNNIDLRIGLRRILESGISMEESKARRFPSVNFSSSASLSQRAAEDYDFSYDSFSTDLTTISKRLTDEDSVSNSQYINLGVNVSWELDLWGKKKKGELAKKAEYEESKARHRGEYLRLVSEIAQAYFDIRQKDKEIDITEKLYEDSRKRFSIYQNQYSEGMIPQWNVLRQKAEVKNSEKELLELERSRIRLENRVATLLNKPAGELRIPKTDTEKSLQIVQVPPGLPSYLLDRRPDIIAAKYQVLKSHHRVGESKAARFPSISLTGNAGLASSSLSTLLRQWTMGIAPTFSFPIFDGGSQKAQIATNEIQLNIAEDEYRKTVMRAFEEVENALTDMESRLKQKEILEEKVKSMRQVRSQTIAKFEMGLLSQLEILDIERELYSSEKSLLAIHRSLLDDSVTLYKALGGGWHNDIPGLDTYLAHSEQKDGRNFRINLKQLVIIENKYAK